MSIGFIGTGTIAAALVTGLCGAGKYRDSIYLSPRNAEKAAALLRRRHRPAGGLPREQVIYVHFNSI